MSLNPSSFAGNCGNGDAVFVARRRDSCAGKRRLIQTEPKRECCTGPSPNPAPVPVAIAAPIYDDDDDSGQRLQESETIRKTFNLSAAHKGPGGR